MYNGSHLLLIGTGRGKVRVHYRSLLNMMKHHIAINFDSTLITS